VSDKIIVTPEMVDKALYPKGSDLKKFHLQRTSLVLVAQNLTEQLNPPRWSVKRNNLQNAAAFDGEHRVRLFTPYGGGLEKGLNDRFARQLVDFLNEHDFEFKDDE
jgi:hypothetical protein